MNDKEKHQSINNDKPHADALRESEKQRLLNIGE
jgi:hypothetical protein